MTRFNALNGLVAAVADVELTNASTLAEMLEAMREFEQQADCDLQIVLFGDGSGHVMAPADASGEGWEEVFRFETVDELGEYLGKRTLLARMRCAGCGCEQPAASACEECGEPLNGEAY